MGLDRWSRRDCAFNNANICPRFSRARLDRWSMTAENAKICSSLYASRHICVHRKRVLLNTRYFQRNSRAASVCCFSAKAIRKTFLGTTFVQRSFQNELESLIIQISVENPVFSYMPRIFPVYLDYR